LILLESGANLGPRALWISGSVLLIIILALWKGYKGLALTTFNADYAKALGISTAFWHFGFMGLVSLTTVVSFESVGAILVVALLIAPPATAYHITDSLKKMLWLTSLLGIFTAIGGYYLALILDGSIAGAMATFAGILFAGAWGWSRVNHSASQNTVQATKQ